MKWQLVFILFSMASAMTAAPSKKIWPKWNVADNSNQSSIDHSRWDQILKKYLISNHPSGIHMFSYNKVSDQDKKLLKEYIQSLTQLRITGYAKREQKAYWINLYNAITIDLVLDHYPVKSIKKIGKGFFSFGPWDDKVATIENEDITLNDIEHRILRPIFDDNRIHYAVNCASRGCPNLADQSFTADRMEAMLHKGAQDFINHKRGVFFRSDKELEVSSIYDWFKVDFGDSDQGVIQHLIKYANGEQATRLKAFKGDLSFDYDWSLNEP